MTERTSSVFRDTWHIARTIASKDVVDAVKNKLVVSILVMLSVVLLLPKVLPLIFEQPEKVVPVILAPGEALPEGLAAMEGYSAAGVRQEDEFRAALCGSLFPVIGLELPAGFEAGPADGPLVLPGFVCWGDRFEAEALRPGLEAALSEALGRPLTVVTEGNLVHMPPGELLFTGVATVNTVVLFLVMGIFLVPALLFEEKERKTMQALLVSPAGIGQVVLGKALAGFFYILVAAGAILVISFADIVHWELVPLFVVLGGLFSVGVGLVIGSSAGRQQDAAGGMNVVILLLVGAVIVRLLVPGLPAFVTESLPWVPSVAMAALCEGLYAEQLSWPEIGRAAGVLAGFCVPLYGYVVWKIRRMDR